MRYVLIASGMALGLALQPVQAADENGTKPQATHEQETLHAPTNRIGEMVPTMTAPDDTNKQDNGGASSGNKAETVHPPTNRVGAAVPTMKSAENKDDTKKSKTYYHGNDEKKSTD